ncbi:MAG: succinyl-diaminopimelate desuccinylase [Candidatus Paracaedibacteraceae bacterium]|nr:succinyl-diaminopimelate desuccinylase [Candidatus Paracaedibacteraceae bacterium]
MNNPFDPVALAQSLIQFNSVTPNDAGCMDYIESLLTPLGFECHRVVFGEGVDRVENFYARFGSSAPHLCFLGHTDVVPVGDSAAWTHPPFNADIYDGHIIGRGACDMKGAIACFISAVHQVTKEKGINGSVSLLLTSDEEGPAQNGIKRMISWLRERGEVFDFCLGGEPTNPTKLGEMVKIGRRGSLSMTVDVIGAMGHVAYPKFALNPIPPIVAFLTRIQALALDEGTEHFDPSNLEITTIDVGNPTSNIIPEKASATLNIRFNSLHTLESLTALMQKSVDQTKKLFESRFTWKTTFRPSAEAFLENNPVFTNAVIQIIKNHTGLTPIVSTSGGTSDARFMKDLCPVLEFGLLSCYAHHVDERVAVKDLYMLTAIYTDILATAFIANN